MRRPQQVDRRVAAPRTRPTKSSQVDRQGGGSGCNMAIDLKRLDPALPVETMGLVGDDDDGRFLLAQCDAFGVERQGLRRSARRRDDERRRLQVVADRPTHAFLSPGRRRADEPGTFRFLAFARAFSASRPSRRPCRMDAPWRGDANGWVGDAARGARGGLADQSRTDVDRAREGRRAGAAVPAAPRYAHRQRLRDRRASPTSKRAARAARTPRRSRAPSTRR